MRAQVFGIYSYTIKLSLLSKIQRGIANECCRNAMIDVYGFRGQKGLTKDLFVKKHEVKLTFKSKKDRKEFIDEFEERIPDEIYELLSFSRSIVGGKKKVVSLHAK